MREREGEREREKERERENVYYKIRLPHQVPKNVHTSGSQCCASYFAWLYPR